MAYSTLANSECKRQRKIREEKREWHFIGKTYICYDGGFKHEHWSKDDYLSCNGENMETKLKQEHEKYLKDKDFKIAAEQTKQAEIRARAERDLEEQRRQAKQDDKDKILRIKELEVKIIKEKRLNEEKRSSNAKQAMQTKHDHEIKLKMLEMEQQAKSAILEERNIKVQENKAKNVTDLLALLRNNNLSKCRGSKFNRDSRMPQIHLNIDPTTGSLDVSTDDNNEVPSAINRLLFN